MPQCNLSKVFSPIRNDSGIALVTALMLTLISLAIIMSLMYMITSDIQRTGATKRYRNALEASYGGTELLVKDLIPYVMRNSASTTLLTDMQASYGSVTVPTNISPACFQAKLTSSTSAWNVPGGCSSTLNPKDNPDVQMSLPGTNGQPFTVYSKIVNTVAGNTDTSGLQLEGAGVAESSITIKPQHFPYTYRVEVEAERSSNPLEKSEISVLYAY